MEADKKLVLWFTSLYILMHCIVKVQRILQTLSGYNTFSKMFYKNEPLFQLYVTQMKTQTAF